jgi:hypothetical protein
MSDAFLSTLGWLPRAPVDFKRRCDALAQSSAPGAELRALATHALDGLQLERLARAISTLRANVADLRPLVNARISSSEIRRSISYPALGESALTRSSSGLVRSG